MTHIGEVVVEMRRDRGEKVLECQADAEKGVPDILGYNFTYLLHLSQVATHKDLPIVWKELMGPSERQNMKKFQRSLDNTG